MVKGGPLLVINGIITPLNGLINGQLGVITPLITGTGAAPGIVS